MNENVIAMPSGQGEAPPVEETGKVPNPSEGLQNNGSGSGANGRTSPQGSPEGPADLLILPSGEVTITECANKLFGRIGPTRTLFIRGGVVMKVWSRSDGGSALEIMKPAAARSLFEKYGRLFAWRKGENGAWVLKPATCSLEMADALLQSQEARETLPLVAGLSNCPILREVGGTLVPSGVGYDEHTKLFVTGGACPPDVELDVAVKSLSGLLCEFDFDSEGDKSRAIASLITPALKFGGFIKGNVPADVAEADQSQSGKTYRQKLIAAVYNEKPSLVTNREGGVGSVDESLSQRLIEGRPFIQLDNFRGRLSSQHLEAFLTADGEFPCRIPHHGEVLIRPDKFFIFLSSNGVDTTRDFANRSSIIRIRKKPDGYIYWKAREGDLLAHVRANQAWFLGCVFAVVRAWYEAGCPRTEETRHDFREWVQILDWIVQKIFGGARIMDGHRQAQDNVSSPAMVFLRRVAIAAEQGSRLGDLLTATDLWRLCEESAIDVPGLPNGAEESPAVKRIGCVLSRVFGKGDNVEVDSYQVRRQEQQLKRDDGQGYFPQKLYCIERSSPPPTDPQATAATAATAVAG